MLAGGCGLLLAWAGTHALRSLAPGALPRADSIQLDAGVVLFLLAATLGVRAARRAAARRCSSRWSGRPKCCARPGRGRWAAAAAAGSTRALVVAEIALAVMLMAGAGLLIRSFMRVQSVQRGFDSSNVLLLQVDLPDSLRRHRREADGLLQPRRPGAFARCPASWRWARSPTSSSTGSPTTASRSKASRRGGPTSRRRR